MPSLLPRRRRGDEAGSGRARRPAVDRLSLGSFWGGMTGANAYEVYVDHLRREHPEAPVPTRKQFWEDKHADAERNPTSRCC